MILSGGLGEMFSGLIFFFIRNASMSFYLRIIQNVQ